MEVVGWLKRSLLVHVWLWCIFIISASIVVTLQACTLVILPFSKRWYQHANGELAKLFWYQYIFLVDYWSGSRVFVYGTEEELKILPKEHKLFVMNHHHDVDWMIMWQFASHFGLVKGGKVVMKDELKYLPIIGWSLYLAEQVFVKRNFAEDRTSLLKQLSNLASYQFPMSLVLFCEGTRFTESKYEKSQAFAKEKGIPGLKHHLLPRTKGFTLSIQAFKDKVPAVYDATMALKGEPNPTFYDINCGKKYECHLYLKRIPLEDVPCGTEEESSQYCHDMYQQKDRAYDFFVQHQSFEGYDPERHRHELRRSYTGPFIMGGWVLTIGIPIIYYSFVVLTTGSIWTLMIVFVIFYVIIQFAKSLLTVLNSKKGGSTYGLKNK